MYRMNNFAQMFVELLGELVKYYEFWAAVDLPKWFEGGFDGHDGVFHHFCRW